MKTSPRGIALIQEFEGFSPVAYRDPVGIWTIGYGFIEGVKEGDRITKEQGAARLRRELVKYEQAVIQATGGIASQNEFDALVSFAFNVGVDALKKSSVIKAHRRGDKQAAARAFGLWNKAGGKVWPGLTRRRSAEGSRYLEPDPDDVSDPVYGPRYAMPQAIDRETPMSGSTINRAASVAGGASALAAVAEVASVATDTAVQVKGVVDVLGAYLVPILLVAVVALCGYIVWQRVKQRKGGWA